MIMDKNKINRFLEKLIITGFFIYAFGSVFSPGPINTGLGICFIGWIVKRILNRERPTYPIPFKKHILFFLAAIIFSFIDTNNLGQNLDYFRRLLTPLILYFILVDLNPSKKTIRIFLTIIFSAILFQSIYGIWQFTAGFSRVQGTLFVLEYATLLVFFLNFLLVFSIWGHMNKLKKIILCLVSITTLCSLIFTGTRGAWLSFLFSFIVILFIHRKHLLVYFLLISLVFSFLAPAFIPDYYIERFISIFDVKHNTGNLTRINLWKGAISIYRDNIINGIGLDNFKKVIIAPPYYKEPLCSTKHAHNNFLQLAAETGSLGLISFLILFFAVLKQIYSYYLLSNSKNTKLFNLSMFGLVLSYLIHGLTEYTLEDRYSTHLMWFLIAICIIVNRNRKIEDTLGDQNAM